jgi:hypothetical protein
LFGISLVLFIEKLVSSKFNDLEHQEINWQGKGPEYFFSDLKLSRIMRQQ